MAILLTALFVIATLLSAVAGIMLLIAAFRVHVGWGIAVLLFGPAALIFVILHWYEARRAILLQIVALLVMASAFCVGLVIGDGTMTRVAATLPVTHGPPDGAEPEDETSEENGGWLNALRGDAPAGAEEEEEEESVDPRDMPGRTIDEAREIFGRERGRLSHDGITAYMFDGFTLVSKDGHTVSDVELLADGETAGETPVRTPRAAAQPAARKSAPNVPAVKVIAQGGKTIDMGTILVPGKVTIVDFYADWCGPCRQMSPRLEQLAREDDAIVLRKVDIVRWESPVAEQYQIQSIPNVRVFGTDGKMTGQPTADISKVRRYVEAAKASG